MKRIFLYFLLIGVLAASCGKDEINSAEVTDTTGGIVDIDTTGMGGMALEGYDRVVAIVFSPTGDATLTGDSDGLTATIDGNGVTVSNGSGSTVAYYLSGSTTDGYPKIYSDAKQALVFNGVSIASSKGAAVTIHGLADPGAGQHTHIVLNGSNSLADGETYSSVPALEDEKAALFSEGGITIAGEGTLSISATGKNAITSDSYVQVSGNPTLDITSSTGHGIRGKNYVLVSGGRLSLQISADMKKGITSDTLVRIDGGDITIGVSGHAGYDTEDLAYSGSAGVRAGVSFIMNGGILGITATGRGGKGINCAGTGTFHGGTVDVTVSGSDFIAGADTVSAKGIRLQGSMLVSGGVVTVRCNHNEAVESKQQINVSAGELYAYSSTSNAVNAKGNVTISGGFVCGHSDANDGLDAGGNVNVTGGLVYAIATDGVHKAVNSGKGFSFSLRGGSMIAVGALENGAVLSVGCQRPSSWTRGTWYAFASSAGTYAFKTPASGSGNLLVAGSGTLTLTSGVTATGGTGRFDGTLLEGASVEGGTAVTMTPFVPGNE